MRHLTFALLALLLAFIPASAEEPKQACTQMWCQEGLTINLNGTDWPAGEYYFAVKLDGKMTHCKGSLPFKSCENNVTCDTKDVTIGESGCALPAASHAFTSITSPLSPTDLGVAIRRADGQFFGWETAGQKICTYPNGLQCDQHECCSVFAELDVVWEKR